MQQEKEWFSFIPFITKSKCQDTCIIQYFDICIKVGIFDHKKITVVQIFQRFTIWLWAINIKSISKQDVIRLLPLSFVLGTPVITAPEMEGNN